MSKRSYPLPSHVELTIRRPDGSIETVRGPAHIKMISPREFGQIQAATRAAGRGEALSYRNIKIETLETDEQYAERLAGEAADRAHAEYVAHHNRVAGMSAAGESQESAQ